LIVVAGCAYTPKTESGSWVASWYGDDFHGRPTASGEIYDMYGKTAAHRTLSLGTQLLVTNPKTGQSTRVVINDRGPFVGGRDLDLSYGAARQIGMVEEGVAVVTVQVLGRDTSYTAEPRQPHGISIQVASFSNRQAADQLAGILGKTFTETRVVPVPRPEGRVYRVLVGNYADKASAAEDLGTLEAKGFSPLIREFFQ